MKLNQSVYLFSMAFVGVLITIATIVYLQPSTGGGAAVLCIDAPADGESFTYDSASGNCEWESAGGETLAATLLLGNTTGGSDIDITIGDALVFSDVGGSIFFTEASGSLTLQSNNQIGAGVWEFPNYGAGTFSLPANEGINSFTNENIFSATNGVQISNAVNGLVIQSVDGEIFFNEGVYDLMLDSWAQTVADGRATIPNLAGVDQDFIMESAAQTLTNKTLTAPVISEAAVTATGELSVDSTDDQFHYYSGGAVQALLPIRTIGFGLENPVLNDDFIFYKAPYAITVLGYDCITVAGTSVTIDIEENSSTGVYQADLDATSVACTVTGAADDGSLTNAVVDAGDWLSVNIPNVIGVPTALTITVRFVINAS